MDEFIAEDEFNLELRILPRLQVEGFKFWSIWNRLSSTEGSPSCSSIYSLITSFMIFPDVTARYPRAQRCRPQNCFRITGNSCINTWELTPLSCCIIWLILCVGRYDTNIWTWSVAILPEMISRSFSAAICLNSSLVLFAMSPTSTFFRYFGTHTKCTLRSVFVWEPIL